MVRNVIGVVVGVIDNIWHTSMRLEIPIDICVWRRRTSYGRTCSSFPTPLGEGDAGASGLTLHSMHDATPCPS